MYVFRQLALKLAEGDHTVLYGAPKLPFRAVDVLPKIKLVVADGKFCSDLIALSAAQTATLDLPPAYSSTKRLGVYIKTTGTVKLTIVSPTHGTSNVLVKATNTAVDGVHNGVYCSTGTVTSIVAAAPAGAANLQLEYFFYELPDLTLADSFRGSDLVVGATPA